MTTKESQSAENHRGNGSSEADGGASKDADKFPILATAPAYLSIFSFFFSLLMVMPFLPFMTKDFVDRPRNELGYYAGFLASAFSVGDLIGSTVWGTLADRYGRRPIMIMSPIASSVFVILFGLSRSFAWAVIARLCWGAVASTMAVTKTLLGELSTESTRARMFALIGFSNGVAGLLGPGLSGLLYKPSAKYASMDTEFWRSHPYLLPCLVVVLVNLVSFVMSLLFLKETLPSVEKHAPHSPAPSSADDAIGDDDDVIGDGDDVINDSSFAAAAAATLGDCGAGEATGNGEQVQLRAVASSPRKHNGQPHRDKTESPLVVTMAASSKSARDGPTSSTTTTVQTKIITGQDHAGKRERRNRQRSIAARIQHRIGHGRRSYRNLPEPGNDDFGTDDAAAAVDDGDDGVAVLLEDSSSAPRGSGNGGKGGCCRGLRMYARILRLLRVRTIRLAVSSYVILALTGMMVSETLPLLLVNNYSHGGLCFNTSEIGVFNSAIAVFQLGSQMFLYPRLAKRFGYRRLHQGAIAVFALGCFLTPWLSSIVGSQDPLPRQPAAAALANQTSPNPTTAGGAYDNYEESKYYNLSGGAPEHCYTARTRVWSSLNTTLSSPSTALPVHGRAMDNSSAELLWNYTTVTLDQCGRVSQDQIELIPLDQRVSEFRYLACLDWWVWPTVLLMRLPVFLSMIMAFTCTNVFINNSCDASVRARVTSLGQMSAAVARSVGPLISILFAWSTDSGLSLPLNYHLTFWVAALITLLTIPVSRRLPASVETTTAATRMGCKGRTPASSERGMTVRTASAVVARRRQSTLDAEQNVLLHDDGDDEGAAIALDEDEVAV
eukprot:scpid33403/ scgid26775/ Probable peptide/nitrate transporter At3g43790; Protein ZINC INDUCED FACILITATOR-LIKE 2